MNLIALFIVNLLSESVIIFEKAIRERMHKLEFLHLLTIITKEVAVCQT